MSLKYVAGLTAVMGVLLLLLAACGDDDESPEEALCNDVDSLQTEVDALRAMDLTTAPLSDIRDQVDDVRNAIGAVQDAAVEVGESRVEALEGSVQALGDTLTDLDAGLSIDEMADAIEMALQDIEDAAVALSASVDCP